MGPVIFRYQHFMHSGVLNSYTNNEAKANYMSYLVSTCRGTHRPLTAYYKWISAWHYIYQVGVPIWLARMPGSHDHICLYIPTRAPRFYSFFLSSSALFAYWLRSSVVSVLFSLISESFRPGNTLIIPIFRTRDLAAVLAHVLLHSVIGLTLPPIDANSFFINCSACPGVWRRSFL